MGWVRDFCLQDVKPGKLGEALKHYPGLVTILSHSCHISADYKLQGLNPEAEVMAAELTSQSRVGSYATKNYANGCHGDHAI
jgi:hypothetical protein